MRTSNATYLGKKGITSVWKNFVMSFASLLQVSCTVLVMMNVNIVMSNIGATNQIVIFLEKDVTEAEIDHVRAVLEKNDDLTDINYVSKEEGLESFREDMGQYAELLEYLPENPAPETFLVRVTDLTKIRYIVEVISSIDSVELVQAPYDFAEALVDIRNTLTVILTAVLATLVTISVIIVSNTIRTSVFSRRNEITIMKYVGATNGFIKTPFFVEGMFIGVLAGAASWGLTWCIYSSIYALFDSELTVWRMFGMYDLIPFDGISWIVLAVNCAAGALLGAVGTTISTGKYLKV